MREFSEFHGIAQGVVIPRVGNEQYLFSKQNLQVLT